MSDPTERVFDAAVKHRIGLNRYSSWLVRRVISQLNRVEKDIVTRLAEAAPDSVAGGRLELLLDAIRVIQAQGWVTIKGRLTEDLTDLAEAEALFADRLTKLAANPEAFTVFSPAPPVGQVMAAVQARPFQGRFLKGWLDDAEEGAAKRVRETIRQGFIEGRPTAEIVRILRGTRANKYRDGVLEISRRGAEAMVRTAITHTANVAHEEAYQANSDIVRGVEWVSVLDSRTTMICASRDGKIYPIGKGPRPPAHINCLVADSHVSTAHRITGATKRWHDGDVIVIRTTSGKQLTCTPNHPILSDRGWIAAGLLKVGGNVVGDRGVKRVPLIDGQHQNVKARIEDVAEATFRHEQMATVPMPTSAEDFHGDGVDDQVAIVATDRRLRDGRKAPLAKHSGQRRLGFRNVGLALMSRLSRLFPFGLRVHATASRLIGFAGEALASVSVHVRHPGALLFRAGPKLVASGLQYPLNGPWRASELQGYSPYTHAREEQPFNFESVNVDARGECRRSHFEPGFLELPVESSGADAQLSRDILDGLAGPVALESIIQVERRKFSGHVFNLETLGGWYVAEGIVTHNCRSTTIPVVDKIEGVVEFNRPTYPEWLANQSAAAQDDILGPARGRLFRSGGLKVESFVDRKGSLLTLQQLRERDAEAFQRAGLTP